MPLRLEMWEQHKVCSCGTPIMFEDDGYGNFKMIEEDGTHHNKERHRDIMRQKYEPEPEPPVKPKNKRMSLDFEIEHEGQKTLKDWLGGK